MSDTFLEIKNHHADLLKVFPSGAKVDVSLDGVQILGDFIRGDGKQGITHPCTPIFGPDRKNLYGLKQHGNMRNEEVDALYTKDGFVIKHIITDPGYPEGMNVEQDITIIDGVFTVTITHTNTGNKDAAVNAGEHCYFDAPEGFAGIKVNGVDITKLIIDNFDGVAIDLKEKNSIQIPGKPAFELTQQGFKKAVVWVGKNPETKEIDQTYVCIEPVEDDPFGDFFGSEESLITPGQSRTVLFRIELADSK